MRAEYITKSSDYDLNTKEQVLYILSRDKMNSEVFTEKIRMPIELQINKEIPLDSKSYWRISPNKKN
ncbi:MAG: hypothetical protein MJ180_04085 [Candidatus Gastranaerophilales bacterium]|nr:hypothetical protein [Candidatus Gastranaerophilales bacterium]